MKKTTISLCLILILSISLNSCATLFSGSKEKIELSSEPSGAEVYLNGVKNGTTPLELVLQKSKNYIIEFRKDGYSNRVLNLNYSLGAGWLILDILAGLIGVIVDAATGNWNGFEFNNYRAVLEKAN